MQEFLYPVLYLGPKSEKRVLSGASREVVFTPGPLYDKPYAAFNEAEARDLITKFPDLFAFPEGMVEAIEALTVPADAQEGEDGPMPKVIGPTPLPADFPSLSALQAAGIDTVNQLVALTRDDLIALKGIGTTTADRIIEALATLEVNDAED